MSGNRAGVRHNSWATTKYYEPRRLPNGQPIALRRNGTIYYMHQDQLGNLVLVTSGGAAVNDQGFYAYGRAQRAPGRGGIGVLLGFTGQQKDFSSGLIYLDAPGVAPPGC